MLQLVVKYGGTSISSAEDIRGVASHIRSLSRKDRVAVVCSATRGTTDGLIEISNSIRRENRRGAEKLASGIAARHKRLARAAVKKPGVLKRLLGGLDADFAELAALIDGMVLLGEVTPRSMDYLISFGERLSIKLVSAAISDAGRRSVPLTGKEAGIITDSNFGASRPLMDTTRLRVSKAVGGVLAGGTVPVVGGFAGADQHGHITTLGRGGSDYTATIIGSCIGADEIWLMSNVDGMMTADPRIVPDARLIPEVSYLEAMEMALFGAKQIHPRTFEPLLAKKIPLRIRNSSDVGNPGTLVTASPAPGGGAAKCVSSVRGNGLIDIRGGSMVGTPGTAALIFKTLADAGVNVMMISQNPSESSITIVVSNPDLDRAVSSLEMGLLGTVIKKLEVTTGVAIIALIGSGMRGTVGVASRVFAAVEQRGINVSMITQGSSELNLAFVVRDADAGAAVGALHGAFGLGRDD